MKSSLKIVTVDGLQIEFDHKSRPTMKEVKTVLNRINENMLGWASHPQIMNINEMTTDNIAVRDLEVGV